MLNKKILQELTDREIEALEIALTASGARAAITIEEYIKLQVNQGVSADVIKKTLLRDLTNGGRMFGEFRRSVQSNVRGSINKMRDAGQFAENGIAEKYRWAAVLMKTCPDCLALHGTVKTWEEWEDEGMPRHRDTVCRHNCRCMLIPSEFTVLKPIQRSK